jgi:hypothetical protein
MAPGSGRWPPRERHVAAAAAATTRGSHLVLRRSFPGGGRSGFSCRFGALSETTARSRWTCSRWCPPPDAVLTGTIRQTHLARRLRPPRSDARAENQFAAAGRPGVLIGGCCRRTHRPIRHRTRSPDTHSWAAFPKLQRNDRIRSSCHRESAVIRTPVQTCYVGISRSARAVALRASENVAHADAVRKVGSGLSASRLALWSPWPALSQTTGTRRRSCRNDTAVRAEYGRCGAG